MPNDVHGACAVDGDRVRDVEAGATEVSLPLMAFARSSEGCKDFFAELKETWAAVKKG